MPLNLRQISEQLPNVQCGLFSVVPSSVFCFSSLIAQILNILFCQVGLNLQQVMLHDHRLGNRHCPPVCCITARNHDHNDVIKDHLRLRRFGRVFQVCYCLQKLMLPCQLIDTCVCKSVSFYIYIVQRNNMLCESLYNSVLMFEKV